MGRFSTNINVKCADFADKFTEIMKKRGYETCTEDYATLSYVIAQGSFWATLAEKNYNSDIRMTLDDTKFIAKELNIPAFMLEVVDSDFAMIKLNGSEVIVGDGSGYGMDNTQTPDRTLWEPLVTDGTFERLTEIWQTHEVFVEDALAKSAPLLGIEPQFIMADYREILDMSDGGNVTKLCFKKIGAGKPLTLKTAFVKVFGEGLEPLGYKLIKGSKLPYFVRVVNDEIIHFITFCNTAPDGRGCNGIKYKCFSVLCGVSTVYNSELDFDTDPEKFHLDFINNISEIYAKNHRNDYDVNFSASIREFYYNPKSAEEMFGAFESALKVTKEIAMPVINQAVTLEKCMDYFEIMGHSVFLPFGNTGEGLLCTKLFSANEYVMFKDRSREREIKECRRELDLNSNLSPKRQKSLEERINYIMARREEDKKKDYDVFTNPELQDKAPANLERRRKENIEKLRDYGLEI